jgi:hypothetical protein
MRKPLALVVALAEEWGVMAEIGSAYFPAVPAN